MIDCSFIHHSPLDMATVLIEDFRFPQASKITPFQAQLAVSIDYDMTNKMVLNQCFRRTHESCCFQNPLPTKKIYLTKKFKNLSCELYPSQSSPYCFSHTCEHLKFAGNAGQLMRFDFIKFDLHDSRARA